jgi:PEP-CTERM motif
MTTLRRILTVSTFALAASGLALANSIAYEASYPTGGPDPNTDFNYTLSLPQFNSSLGTLTGVELIIFGSESISTVTLANLGTSAQPNFTATETSTLAQNSTDPLHNSATGNNVYSGLVLDVFSSGNISLGPGTGSQATGVCPPASPSTGCSSVTYTAANIPTDPDTTVNDPNTGCLQASDCVTGDFITGNGLAQNTFLSDYIGSGTFSLSGSTLSGNTVTGGGSVSATIISTGYLEAEVDYTYTTPSSTPEPGTMALLGAALLGFGFVGRKRFRKS